MRQDRAADHAVRLFSLMGLGMPSFWFGIILIVLLSVDVHLFPVGGYGTTSGPICTRSCCPDCALRSEPSRCSSAAFASACSKCSRPTTFATARAKGLRPSRVTFVHVARNALIPTVTLLRWTPPT